MSENRDERRNWKKIMDNIEIPESVLIPERKVNKKLVMGMTLSILLLTLVVAVVILITNVPTSVNVSEALSTNSSSLSFSGYPGENIIQSININNAASVSLYARLSFNETNNTAGVNYTTNLPLNVTVSPGVNNVNVAFTISNSSQVGTVNGNVVLERLWV